ncbi:MAG: 3-methylcrotonyl-CoA carboxylase [Caulobacter sp.]|nr:3-methylcrotonyl-CoA carboxylase [Caulobacter sp.]
MMARAFSKILVANRGEIAVRVMRTARALGYRSVAVASEADRDALHARFADETVEIGPPPAAQSYLVVERILEAASRTGADAIHPGYGFLSENADFAEAVIAAGLVWIGPTPASIRMMGDKASSKRLMLERGVPCIPGYQGHDQDHETLMQEAERIGRPLMVKASAGGGGKGMRLVHEGEAVAEAIAAARSEARSSFGSDHLILERAVVNARHVEIQVFGDGHGNILHLGERDCSVQRRHQKVIEEAPSPAVDAALRERMGQAAVAAARAVEYVGAGTVEFLLAADGAFYFLEMNTRLQVEHPVTESITGLDLVAWQLRVAAGEPLPISQDEVRLAGAAIEVRLYAESPAAGFLPRTGRIERLRLPQGEGIRVDHGLREGMEIGASYDPMLAKVVAYGATRDEALRRLARALEDCFIAGCETNRAFLITCLQDPVFASGAATTAFIGERFGDAGVEEPPTPPELVALAALLLGGQGRGWASTGARKAQVILREGDTRTAVDVQSSAEGSTVTLPGGQAFRINIVARDGCDLRFRCDGVERTCRHAMVGRDLHLSSAVGDHVFTNDTLAGAGGGETERKSSSRAPMSGVVQAVLVSEGDTVSRGQPMAILEAMKMEHRIAAPRDGVVSRVHVTAGDQVATRALLVELADE